MARIPEKEIERLKKENNPEVEKEEKQLKTNIEKYQSLKNTPVRFPELTFTEEIVLHPDTDSDSALTLEVIFPGNTHTSDGCIVYFPGLKAIHLADMILDGIHPLIYKRDYANTQNWTIFLKKVLNWDIEIVIPGHGEMGTKKIIKKQDASSPILLTLWLDWIGLLTLSLIISPHWCSQTLVLLLKY